MTKARWPIRSSQVHACPLFLIRFHFQSNITKRANQLTKPMPPALERAPSTLPGHSLLLPPTFSAFARTLSNWLRLKRVSPDNVQTRRLDRGALEVRAVLQTSLRRDIFNLGRRSQERSERLQSERLLPMQVLVDYNECAFIAIARPLDECENARVIQRHRIG